MSRFVEATLELRTWPVWYNMGLYRIMREEARYVWEFRYIQGKFSQRP